MEGQHAILNTVPSDMDFIYSMFDNAIAYQKRKGYPVWKDFDQGALLRDSASGNHYKIVIENQIALVFSVCYSDPLIWGNRENGKSVYLHRIVVNPAFKGKKLFSTVLSWAIGHCKKKNLPSVRMDTWFENNVIIEYYKSFGFALIGDHVTPDSHELASQNRNLRVALLEYKITV